MNLNHLPPSLDKPLPSAENLVCSLSTCPLPHTSLGTLLFVFFRACPSPSYCAPLSSSTLHQCSISPEKDLLYFTSLHLLSDSFFLLFSPHSYTSSPRSTLRFPLPHGSAPLHSYLEESPYPHLFKHSGLRLLYRHFPPQSTLCRVRARYLPSPLFELLRNSSIHHLSIHVPPSTLSSSFQTALSTDLPIPLLPPPPPAHFSSLLAGHATAPSSARSW